MGMRHTYDVYYGDELLIRGGSREIQDYFGLSSQSMTPYIQGCKIKGKYRVVVNDEPGDMDRDLYDVMEKGKVVYTGTNSQIIETYNLQPCFRGSVYAKFNYKIHRKFNVRKHEDDVVIHTDPSYDEALWHLKYTPNNNYYISARKKDRIVKKLEENGIKVDVRITSDRKGYVLWAV